MIVQSTDPELAQHILGYEHLRASGHPRARLYLAEGDSWFSIGGWTTSLLHALDDVSRLIVVCAEPGDTMRRMSALAHDSSFRLLLDPRHGTRWDGILLSGGGNDALGSVQHALTDPDALFGGITDSYRTLVARIREQQECPIYAHTYDYITPDPHGGLFRLGPWVGNRLRAFGVPEREMQAVCDGIVDRLAETILDVDGLTVFDTRGTLPRQKWRRWGWMTTPWRNEIHPAPEGYNALGAKWRV